MRSRTTTRRSWFGRWSRPASAPPAWRRLLGRTLAVVLEGDRHQGFLNEAVRLAAQAISDSRDYIRERVRAESPWWVPGVVDDKIYQRIIEVTEALLRAIGSDPTHPLRTAFDSALRDFVERLQHSPDVIARVEAMKEDWLADPSVAELSSRLWEATRRAIVTYATREDGAAPTPLERGLSSFGTALLANDALLAELDDVVIGRRGRGGWSGTATRSET